LRVRGIQTDVEYHFASDWRVAAAYVYDQAKVTEHAGHKVVVAGTLTGDTIKVESIKVDSGCIPGPTGCQ